MEGPSTTTSQTTPAPRLYRSKTDSAIAGVCGGLAAYFGFDPVLVRLAFVVFALAGGASVLLYLVLWIAVPLGDTVPARPARAKMGGETTALLLIGVGLFWLLANLGVFRFINWNIGWPVVIIALGVAMLLRGR